LIPRGHTPQSPATVAMTSDSVTPLPAQSVWKPADSTASAPIHGVNRSATTTTDCAMIDGLIASRSAFRFASDSILDELAADSMLWPGQQESRIQSGPGLPGRPEVRPSGQLPGVSSHIRLTPDLRAAHGLNHGPTALLAGMACLGAVLHLGALESLTVRRARLAGLGARAAGIDHKRALAGHHVR
jgi:hypothetical protein